MCFEFLFWWLDYVIHFSLRRRALLSAKHSELAEALKAYRAKAENCLHRLEQVDIERTKAANGEKPGTF